MTVYGEVSITGYWSETVVRSGSSECRRDQMSTVAAGSAIELAGVPCPATICGSSGPKLARTMGRCSRQPTRPESSRPHTRPSVMTEFAQLSYSISYTPVSRGVCRQMSGERGQKAHVSVRLVEVALPDGGRFLTWTVWAASGSTPGLPIPL